MQRALKGGGGPTWRMDDADVQLVFATSPRHSSANAALHF
jgi:hypothetical protein